MLTFLLFLLGIGCIKILLYKPRKKEIPWNSEFDKHY